MPAPPRRVDDPLGRLLQRVVAERQIVPRAGADEASGEADVDVVAWLRTLANRIAGAQQSGTLTITAPQERALRTLYERLAAEVRGAAAGEEIAPHALLPAGEMIALSRVLSRILRTDVREILGGDDLFIPLAWLDSVPIDMTAIDGEDGAGELAIVAVTGNLPAHSNDVGGAEEWFARFMAEAQFTTMLRGLAGLAQMVARDALVLWDPGNSGQRLDPWRAEAARRHAQREWQRRLEAEERSEEAARRERDAVSPEMFEQLAQRLRRLMRPPATEPRDEQEPGDVHGGGVSDPTLVALLHKKLIARRASMHAAEYRPAKRAVARLRSTVAELNALHEQTQLKPHASRATPQFEQAEKALRTLDAMTRAVRTIDHDFDRLFALQRAPVHQAINEASNAEQALIARLDALAKEAEELARSYAPKAKVVAPTTATRREGGTEGIFDPPVDETALAAWVDAKLPAADRGNVDACVAVIMTHTPLSGGGTGTLFSGVSVFHVSHGRRNSSDGCTVFFTKSAAIITIVGIGQHVKDFNARYKLGFKVPGWTHLVFSSRNAMLIDLEKKTKWG